MHTIQRFTKENLLKACHFRVRDGRAVDSKRQLLFLHHDLQALNCKTMLIEDNYIDRDYLDDYATYYAKCYRGYSRYCRRLHFFATPFEQSDFDGMLRCPGTSLETTLLASAATRPPKPNKSLIPHTPHLTEEGDADEKRGPYLGFIVLRPLPDTFIGRTCIAHYPSKGRRKYTAIYPIHVHVAGLDLAVTSLPFQEQDTVLSACATTSLWSALHQTSHLFGHTTPTPSAITRHATEHGHHHGRVLPSAGLELGQMCRAILSAGLEVELRKAGKIEDLRGLLYAYSRFGLPIVLGIHSKGSGSDGDDKHAVVMVGYSLPQRRSSNKTVSLVAHGIDKLYVHDDQVGPFARATFVGKSNTLSMPSPEREGCSAKMDIFAVIIPVYPKIRITYEAACDAVSMLAVGLARMLRERPSWARSWRLGCPPWLASWSRRARRWRRSPCEGSERGVIVASAARWAECCPGRRPLVASGRARSGARGPDSHRHAVPRLAPRAGA